MLLNLSNHPSDKWPAAQAKAAVAAFGRIQDLPFPQIPPQMTSDELDDLVELYRKKINACDPKAIHLMGEMTFTFRLVTKLKAAGMRCLASTTHRLTEERAGRKIVQFQFVQFRDY